MKTTLYTISLLALILLESCTSQQAYNNTYTGSISGYAYDEFALDLKTGNTLSIDISEPALEVIIVAPISLNLAHHESVPIMKSGQYIIRVLLPRAVARRNKSYPYQLIMHIKENY